MKISKIVFVLMIPWFNKLSLNCVTGSNSLWMKVHGVDWILYL